MLHRHCTQQTKQTSTNLQLDSYFGRKAMHFLNTCLEKSAGRSLWYLKIQSGSTKALVEVNQQMFFLYGKNLLTLFQFNKHRRNDWKVLMVKVNCLSRSFSFFLQRNCIKLFFKILLSQTKTPVKHVRPYKLSVLSPFPDSN